MYLCDFKLMRILIVHNSIIPAFLYGGTERVIWCLGNELVKLGHEVVFLVKEGSSCDFAPVIPIDNQKNVTDQIPAGFDIIHFHFDPGSLANLQLPYVMTMHGNQNNLLPLYKNTIFISKDHAQRFQSGCFVHNGLDWDQYTPPDLNAKRNYFHFLGNASWRVKNVKGAIDVIRLTRSEKLKVLGGVRFNFNMGIRFTFSPRAGFTGMVGGKEKDRLLNASKGLLFPVRWAEPFGLAIIESLFYGCPVFGTPYGSLPELVPADLGFLSASKHELSKAVENAGVFSREKCHDYAREMFNSKKMALGYLNKYETVLSGQSLHPRNPVLKQVQEEKFLPWS